MDDEGNDSVGDLKTNAYGGEDAESSDDGKRILDRANELEKKIAPLEERSVELALMGESLSSEEQADLESMVDEVALIKESENYRE